ncbi:unnamed protein product [Soboliphyme baturini]|uniref:RxLR effector candidate protein n=1 Tax=Soboliphyme baturini TaxID=241478 RepID=A0A183IG03_9BILA|nr:unnamed protein product [Soboliphyme baturini]
MFLSLRALLFVSCLIEALAIPVGKSLPGQKVPADESKASKSRVEISRSLIALGEAQRITTSGKEAYIYSRGASNSIHKYERHQMPALGNFETTKDHAAMDISPLAKWTEHSVRPMSIMKKTTYLPAQPISAHGNAERLPRPSLSQNSSASGNEEYVVTTSTDTPHIDEFLETLDDQSTDSESQAGNEWVGTGDLRRCVSEMKKLHPEMRDAVASDLCTSPGFSDAVLFAGTIVCAELVMYNIMILVLVISDKRSRT